MTGTASGLAANENALRDEAASIQERRPDAILSAVKPQPDSYVGTDAALVATNAEVFVEQGTDAFPLRVVFTDGLKRRCLHTDPATALALFHALDDAIVVCDACRVPLLRDDAEKCAGSGAWFCRDDHRGGACSNRAECFADGGSM